VCFAWFSKDDDHHPRLIRPRCKAKPSVAPLPFVFFDLDRRSRKPRLWTWHDLTNLARLRWLIENCRRVRLGGRQKVRCCSTSRDKKDCRHEECKGPSPDSHVNTTAATCNSLDVYSQRLSQPFLESECANTKMGSFESSSKPRT
jgi:hypothetical protein